MVTGLGKMLARAVYVAADRLEAAVYEGPPCMQCAADVCSPM